jgi:NAD(P)-dependent dehydrogenase (short-subunit alcohol dehydrogenase family)
MHFAASLDDTRLRGLVLCAVDYGSAQRHPAAATQPEEWQRAIATNCLGHCILISQLLSRLVMNAPGTIINVSSDVALLPGAGRAAYAASKAGLHAALRAVAAEHPPECLRVYQLVPTFQSLTEGIRRRRPDDFKFDSYADPGVLATIVTQILCPGASDVLAPGTYLVRRNGELEAFAEKAGL